MGILTTEERVTHQLRELYQEYGYKRFKMSKFEEYDLYVQNRSFLASSQILTFTNTDGKLMALKPDVTLSIVKNTKPAASLRKVYYTEQVYRAADADSGFREITQTGLECIGDIDLYAMSEVVLLAAKSLESISDSYILNLSHIGVLSGILDAENFADETKSAVLRAVGQKNAHELAAILASAGASDDAKQSLLSLISVYGAAQDAAAQAECLPLPESSRRALAELRQVISLLAASGAAGRVYLDFSIVNDMDYYNGLFFRGFVSGVPQGILAGGRYDNLLSRMGKSGSAIGFAVYLDQLENLPGEESAYDVDALILYGADADPEYLASYVARRIAGGYTVRVEQADDGSVSAREKLRIVGKEAVKVD